MIPKKSILRRTTLVGVLALYGSLAKALPVRVAIDWPAGTPMSAPAQVHIQAIQTVGYANSAGPIESEGPPSGGYLDLGDGVWQLQASAPGYWSQAAEIAVTREGANVQLALWPAASFHGAILTTGGEPLPSVVKVGLSAIPASTGSIARTQEPSPSRAELLCPIDAGSWSCPGPAGLFDAQLEVPGYVPRYEWGVSLKAGASTDLGRTELRRTASVFGRALRSDGSDPPGPCRANLGPDLERSGPPEPGTESVPTGTTNSSVALSSRGYFQIVGVSPGRYALSVECPAAGAVSALRVLAETETRIDPPLLLDELALSVAITPKLDPEGRPWQLTVDEAAPRLRRVADKVTTSADGKWTGRGLAAGTYRVLVSSADGTSWPQRYFELGTRSGPLSLPVESLKVAGRVLLGTQPVRARLVFSNSLGGESATLTSDEDGRFQGLLPVAPDLPEASWTVEAHLARPPVSQRLSGVIVQPVGGGATTWLDLALPTIAVRGNVISDDGQPERGIQVTFENSNGARATTGTDNAGNFEKPDLPPGKYTAVADSGDGVSDRTPFEVVEGMERELKLVLHTYQRIPFYVVSSQGPIEGATVQVWLAPGVPRGFGRTDQDGRFDVKLPPGTTEVGLTAGAPGYAVKLLRIPLSSQSDQSPDAHTVTLSASGGKLVLNLQPPERTPDISTTPYLVHNGAIEVAGPLAAWGTDQTGSISDGSAVVEAIDPGDYALCFLADTAELSAIWQGSLSSANCRTGSVEPGQTLTLSLR